MASGTYTSLNCPGLSNPYLPGVDPLAPTVPSGNSEDGIATIEATVCPWLRQYLFVAIQVSPSSAFSLSLSLSLSLLFALCLLHTQHRNSRDGKTDGSKVMPKPLASKRPNGMKSSSWFDLRWFSMLLLPTGAISNQNICHTTQGLVRKRPHVPK
eukprot:COSAG03_NODE_987_length_5098_cov_24.705341_6_plen_155_part_00